MHAFMAFQIACSLERLAADVTKGAVRRVVGGDGAGGAKIVGFDEENSFLDWILEGYLRN
jgi:hypothetical protein